MSKQKSQEEYSKTKAGKFFSWLDGEKDPFVDKIEMKPRAEVVKEELPIEERLQERAEIYDKVYDLDHNKEIKVFNKLYKICSVIFCILLIAVDRKSVV